MFNSRESSLDHRHLMEQHSRSSPWAHWSPDAAAVAGLVVVIEFLLPARLVVAGLGAAGRPSLLLGLGLLIAYVASWLMPGALTSRARHPLRRAVLAWSIALLMAYFFGVARTLTSPELSGADRALLQCFALIGIALAVSDGTANRERLNAVLKMLVGAGTFMATLGVLERLTGSSFAASIALPGLVANGEIITAAERGEGQTRIASTAGHYIEFGVVAALILPIAIHFALHSAGAWRRRVFAACSAILLVAGLISVSRSPIVTLAAVSAVMLIPFTWRQRFNAAVLGAAVLTLAWITVPGLVGTIRSLFTNATADPSVQGRLTDYSIAALLIRDRPWFGRGPGTFSPEQYILLDNQWLGTLIEAGLVGFLALFTLFFVAVALAVGAARHAHASADRNLGFAIASALVGSIVASFLFDSLFFSKFAIVSFVLIGSAGALWRFTMLELDRRVVSVNEARNSWAT